VPDLEAANFRQKLVELPLDAFNDATEGTTLPERVME
jgi:hypothetical protein